MQNKNFTFLDIILILVRNIRIILMVPTFLCIISIINVFFFAKPSYRSISKIASSSSSSSLSQALGMASQFGIKIPGSQVEQKWVYPEILNSKTLYRAVLNKKFNTIEFGENKRLLQILTHGNEPPSFSEEILIDKAIRILSDMVNITENVKRGIFTISVDASEPLLSSQINNAIINGLQIHQQKTNKNKTYKTRVFIEQRISKAKSDLESKEESLKDFRSRNRRIENSPALKLEQERLSREVSVLTGVYTTLMQQLEITKIEELKESDYVVVIDPPYTPVSRHSPNRKLVVIVTGIFGLFLGIFISLIREFRNSLISENDELNKLKEIKNSLYKQYSNFFHSN